MSRGPQKGYRQTAEHRGNISKAEGENNSFFGRHHTESTCKIIGEAGKGRNAGEKHYLYGKHLPEEHSQHIREALKGENCWNWQGGITSLNCLIRNSKEYARWRDAVFAHDDYRDRYTNETSQGDLNAHHIIPLSILLKQNNIKTFEEAVKCEALWDVDNGVTMIEANHMKFHRGNHGP
jgi:hypothetical protein